MAATAIFGIRLNVRNLDRAEQFYRSIGMVEDIGLRLEAGDVRPPTVIAGTESVALRWPYDPYMHLILAGPGPAAASGRPEAAGRIGATTMTFLVPDLDAELARLTADGYQVAAPPAESRRCLGTTRSALVLDPDTNPVELISLDPGPGWDNSGCSPAAINRTFLHFELNTDNFKPVSDFYAAFGFEHNGLNNVREGWSGLPGDDRGDPFVTAFGRALDGYWSGDVSFFRLPSDHSQMHLEIMGWKPEALLDPATPPTFHQRGVMRFCFKITDVDRALDDMRRRGLPILQERQRCAIAWGDSEWFFSRDPDGNILAFEEWLPAGYWGERC